MRALLRTFLAFTPVAAAIAVGCSATPGFQAFGGGTGGDVTGSSTSTSSGSGGGASSSGSTSSSSSGSSTSSSSSGASSSSGQGGGGGGGSGSSSTSSSSSTSGNLDGGSDGPIPIDGEVFAHSANTLFKLDPNTKQVTTVGDFTNNDLAVIDIALDKNGLMYGTTFGGLYKINKLTAACSLVSSGSYPNSLSFVPAGTVDPVNEALVGYEGSSYVRMDLVTGNKTTIGNLGNNNYVSSGDLVSLIGGGTYLTVNGGGCGDCIVEVNPKTGALVSMIGPLGHSSVFGLAYWGGVAYGFDNAGELFQIDVMNGQTVNIPIPNAPPGLSFYGAGSTTAAPHM